MREIIFLTGVYGVGKTSIDKYIEEKFNIPYYSASQLISSNNNEEYGVNKFVSDRENNQAILIASVNKIKDSIFVLDGHFCLLEKDNKINALNESFYKDMNITRIILLYAKDTLVFRNLLKRDKKEYDLKFVSKIIDAEERQARKVAEKYNIPLYKLEMNYNGLDGLKVDDIFHKIKRKGTLE